MAAALIVQACTLFSAEELSGPELTATFDTRLGQVQQTANAASGGDTSGDEDEAPTATDVPQPTNTIEPPPTVPGAPAVTANVNANVREGPSTDFKGVGGLLNGQSATIEGRNANSYLVLHCFHRGAGWQGLDLGFHRFDERRCQQHPRDQFARDLYTDAYIHTKRHCNLTADLHAIRYSNRHSNIHTDSLTHDGTVY